MYAINKNKQLFNPEMIMSDINKNKQLFNLEMIWKGKQPDILWEIFPTDIILKIFQMVDNRFIPPKTYSIGKIQYEYQTYTIPEMKKIETIKVIKESFTDDTFEKFCDSRNNVVIIYDELHIIESRLKCTPIEKPSSCVTEEYLTDLKKRRTMPIEHKVKDFPLFKGYLNTTDFFQQRL